MEPLRLSPNGRQETLIFYIVTYFGVLEENIKLQINVCVYYVGFDSLE